jgi:hypothetical protein
MATSAAATPQPLIYLSYDQAGAAAAKRLSSALEEGGVPWSNALRELPASRGAVVIAADGDLSDDQLRELGSIAARADGDYALLGFLAPGAKAPSNVPSFVRLTWEELPTDLQLVATALRAYVTPPEGEAPKLSPSVDALSTRRLPGAVTAAAIVFDLLDNHANYRRDWAGTFDAQPFDNARRQPVADWIAETRRVLAWERIEELHGQLLIVGLALLEPSLGRRLLEIGFLPAIERRYKPPLRPLLTAHGMAMLDALATPSLAGFAADSVEGDDLLGIDRDVEALAAIVTAKDSVPPLSVGLFGRWGSGKSFFMEQMRKRIIALSTEALTAEEDDPSPFCGNVVQIKFNAWHYIDANLWASLAAHIFAELDRYGRPDETAELFSHLHSAQLVREEAKKDRKAAESRRDRLEQRVGDLRERSDTQVHKLTSAGVLASVAKSSTVQGLLRDAGIDKADRETLENLRTFPGRVRVGWRKLSLPARIGAGIVVALLAAGTFVAIAHESLGPAAGTAVAALASVLAVARPVLRTAGDINAAADAEERRLRSEAKAELAVVARELVEAEHALDVATGKIDAAEAAVVAAQAAGTDLRPFIEQRVTSGEYSRQLGLISVIQRDFDRMSRLLVPDDRNGKPADSGLPTIDRIVLYIDDLDRCPASLVVEVLQAVHLLLAFKLFVVVVGVDPHWLTSSLSRHHAAMLSSESTEAGPVMNGDEKHYASTPRDYLEKIFQIPFALEPMRPDGYAHMVGELIPVRQETGTAPGDESTTAPQSGPVPSDVPTGAATVLAPVDLADEAGDVRVTRANLVIEPQELALLQAIGPMIPTPRALKRLVNVYRFVRAGLPAPELSAFADPGNGDYQAVIVLLAVLVGYPDDATDVFGILAKGSHETWRDFLDFIDRDTSTSDFDPDLRTHLRALAPKHVADDYSVALFRDWIPRVERFSFG